LGQTTITVKFLKHELSVSKSFTVNIEESYRTIETNLTKEGNYYNLLLDKNAISYFSLKTFEGNVENSKIKLKFEFETNNANVSIIQYESNVVLIRATSEGEAILKVYCEDDESVFIKIKIEVS